MKKGTIIATFLLIHVSFIFLQIHKHMRFIKHSFDKQKNERLLASLEKQKQELYNQLYALQNKSDIQAYARDHLHMQALSLKQIKRLNHEN